MTDPDRAEQAFRAALDEVPPDHRVDPARARRTARDRRNARLGVGAVATALVLVVGVLGLPRLLADPTGDVAAPASATGRPVDPPRDPAPTGWRTEYYRNLGFRVPSSWGYAYQPGPDWCAGVSGEPSPDAEHRTPYVSLGGPSVVATVGCPDLPDSLLSEHVATTSRFAGDDPVSGTTRRGGWLIVQQVFPEAVLVVTTKDRSLADRIIGSAGPATADAPCSPSSPVTSEPGARPQPGFDLAGLAGVRAVSVCQYDTDGADDDQVRLRARRSLTGQAASALVDRLAAAPTNPDTCAAQLGDIALVVAIWADSGRHDVYVQAAGCESTTTIAGGIADGRSVRQLTRGACRALLVPPVTLEVASEAVAKNCLD